MLNYQFWFFLAILWQSAQSQFAGQIDKAPFTTVFANRTSVTLDECYTVNGRGWAHYDFLDIQKRVGVWLVPLFILIGSFQFAQLGRLNGFLVFCNILACPWTSIYNLLTKLAAYQDIHRQCHRLPFRPDTRRSVAIIVASLDDWQQCLACLSHEWSSMGRIVSLARSVIASNDTRLRTSIFHEFHLAAQDLSDARVNGLGKTSLGTANYIIAVWMALWNVARGDLNNRTGHSMAFGILWTWLLVLVFLSALTGGFITKRSVRKILMRLDRHLQKIAVAEAADREEHREHEEMEQIINLLHEPLFPFNTITDLKDAYSHLSWLGMNYSLNPSPACPSHLKVPLALFSLLPIILACSAANWLSVTNPTYGFGCRNLEQCIFLLSWLISACLTLYFHSRFSPKTAARLTHTKDIIISLAISISFIMGFIGWFNSCWCWSSWFSNWRNPYIVFDPKPHMMALAKGPWRKIAFPALGMQITFIAVAAVWFWKGWRVFEISDDEHEGLFAGGEGRDRMASFAVPRHAVENYRMAQLQRRREEELREVRW
ncbi:hypothetical protein BKA61DRAFT_723225 [Leptodontidium sp. MPI-SDFR-AT-0119]|nr:hypothetical protein BKA61DRAFT_723225 [Leptodontidium sp. MPI-SDFR-AT-0119]